MAYKSSQEYIDKIILLIKNKNGILLSEILNFKEKIKIKCKNNHIFFITPTKIVQNRWCWDCRKVPFEKIKAFVENKGGKIVGGTYERITSRLKFECKLRSYLGNSGIRNTFG